MSELASQDSVIAFDFGTQSIGVAVGQRLLGTGTELAPLRAKEGIPHWQQIAVLIETWQPELVLVGLPLNMDGSEGEITRRARKFGKRIHGRFGLALAFVDERLSTREAKQVARARGQNGSYKDKPVDSIAARLLLESWWRDPVAMS